VNEAGTGFGASTARAGAAMKLNEIAMAQPIAIKGLVRLTRMS
jgi:hypothetical protein